MSLAWLGLGYLAIGGVLAVTAAIAGRLVNAGDAMMMAVVWPIAAPLCWLGDGRVRDDTLLDVVTRAQGSPLASVLPDLQTTRVLQGRLREAVGRLAELEDLLGRPDFDPQAARRRAEELLARGASAAAATAQLRVRTLGQLHQLRERYRHELDDVRELTAQLIAQAELVRLQPAVTQGSSELVRELVSRVEGLSDLFASQAELEYTATVERSA